MKAIHIQTLLPQTQREDVASPIENAVWLTSTGDGGGFSTTFPPGTLSAPGVTHLACDLLLAGFESSAFILLLHEGLGLTGPRFGFMFGLLGECQARLTLPLSATDQNAWRMPRQGALLKPLVWGDRVDLAKVERVSFLVLYRGSPTVRWAMTPISVTEKAPPLLTDPVLPKGKLLDEFGQAAVRQWPGKTVGVDELKARISEQLAASSLAVVTPHQFRWGGSDERRLTDGSGFFAVRNDGKRWWLVDPDGYAFWSAGMDCVRHDIQTPTTGLEKALTWLPPRAGEFSAACSGRVRADGSSETFDYLTANLIRGLSAVELEASWQKIVFHQLRQLGINTVGNWSDWRAASRARFPYVRPLEFTAVHAPCVYRDLPDVFHPAFAEDAAQFAEQLRESVSDPAMIGYFLMNEPTWGFARQSPAAGVLFATNDCHVRDHMAAHFRTRYGSNEKLSEAWGMAGIRFSDLASGQWNRPLSAAAATDLEEFSTIWVERYISTLSAACKRIDPNHLNLGARYHTVPPDWVLKGMKGFDVFSINCYQKRVPHEALAHIGAVTGLPTLVGEFHFGATDVGLPAAGMMAVASQEDRGAAYRVYIESAAAAPWCVGAHYFTLYDQSALGRFDGEAFNIGFLDVCNRPYAALWAAAKESHARLYEVATGQTKPFEATPKYLPSLAELNQ